MRLTCLVLALVAVVTPAAPTATPATVTAPDATERVNRDPRVRPYDSRSAALLIEGLRRSDRLREIVEAVEASDVIVYLQTQPALKDRVAGTVTWLTSTPRYRYLRISLNPTVSGELAVAYLGHELQHVVEIANEPSIVSEATLEAFYRRTGIRMLSHTSGWDTEAARVAGEQVRRELSASRASRATESIAPFDPMTWNTAYRKARERR